MQAISPDAVKAHFTNTDKLVEEDVARISAMILEREVGAPWPKYAFVGGYKIPLPEGRLADYAELIAERFRSSGWIVDLRSGGFGQELRLKSADMPWACSSAGATSWQDF
jgi:hypothetical protein